MELSDSRLVAEAIAGSGRAFDELVFRYRSRVYYLALSKVKHEETARDLAQETFVHAYLSLARISEPERFGAWIAAIASNLSNSYLRRPRELVLPVEQVMDMRDSIPAATAPRGDSTALEILYSLPNGARTAAILYFVEQMKMAEIAEFLGIALSAVKSRIRTARNHIKKEMVDMVRQTAKKHEPGEEFNHSLKHRLELARWYRELGELFEIGVNVRTALARLAEADYSEAIKQATLALRAAVDSGSSIHAALESIPALVAPQTIPMIKAGETSGRLEWSAEVLADRIEAEEAKQKIELSFWCRVLGGMWHAGVPMVEALRGTAEATRSKALSQAAIDLAQCVEEKRPVREVMDKYSDVLPPMLRVVLLTGIPLLSYKLDWVGARIAEDICRHVVGREIEVPAPHIDGLAGSTHLWADPAIELLQDDDPGIRAAAAHMLGRFKVESAASELMRLLGDPDTEVVMSAIRAMIDLGSSPSAEALTARLEARDPSVRRAAVQALKELDLVHATSQHLAELLADSDERVAHIAVRTLEDAREIEVLGNQAVRLLRDSEDPELRCRAAGVLDRRLFPAPEALLVAALTDELPSVRYAAAKLLGHRRDVRSVPVIREAVEACKLSQDYLFLADDLEKG